jgi:putative transposase
MSWKTLLAYITGTVDQELLVRNEYLVTENRILRNQIQGRLWLSDGERKALADIGQKMDKQALKEVATIVKPETILGWHRKLVAQKWDGSKQRKAPGRPTIDPTLEALVVRMAQDNRSWGYDRIVGALANLGYTISDQTVGNILKRHGLPQLRSVRPQPRGRHSSARIWTYWSPPTSSPPKSGRWVGW